MLFWLQHLKEEAIRKNWLASILVDNMGTDLREIGWEIVDWTHLAQDMDH
jgi:hypothetical protein